MRKQLLIHSVDEALQYKTKINSSINELNKWFKDMFCDGSAINMLYKIKFSQCGFDPLFDEPMNFIEMTNQVFTYIACLSAVEMLLTIHPKHHFFINFGTENGHDIISEDESIICECFAATTPNSNSKLEKDTIKVYGCKTALYKYVIFYTHTQKQIHVENIKRKYEGVKIIALDTL